MTSIAPLLDQDKVEQALENHPWMSYKQAKWLFNLINDRVAYNTQEFADYRASWLQVSNQRQFQFLLESLQALPKLSEQVNPPTRAGLYQNPITGILYRVTSTHACLFASQLVEIGGERLTEHGTFVKYDWKPVDIKTIDASWKTTDEQKAAFGIRYGHCATCHRALKDATSVTRGIGPECWKKR